MAAPSPPPPPPGLAASNPPATPPRSGGSTQLGDQFRESVQAGAATEDLPQEGWFVGVNGVPLGPIPLGDLRELAIAGHIDRRSLVWRDGQPEWRPLGKFPGLARVIDEGGSPAPPRAEPGAAYANGANGHVASAPLAAVATGFDVPRADAGERPSAWGDLDDEEDEDEQPTTVKGRVSVMPSAIPSPSVGSLSAPPPPPGLPPGAPNPFGLTSAPVPAPGMALGPAPGASSTAASDQPAAALSIMSAVADSMGDAEESLRPRRRSKWYLVAVAIVFAFALGAIVTHLMRSSSSEKPSSDASGSREPSGDLDPSYASAAIGSEAAAVNRSGHASGARPESITAALRPGAAELDSDLSVARTTIAPGLEAVAIERTVRRYSPGVRQSCWLPAIHARRPGVPTSVKLTATISVEARGRVQAVAVSGAPHGYPTLSRCVEAAVKSWQFPRSTAPTITNVPFMFMGR